MVDRLLIIGATPDDPCALAGGTLSRFHREGWETKIYICCRGVGCTGIDEAVKLYKRWADEVIANPKDMIDPSANTSFELAEVIKGWRPNVIITHNVDDRFMMHRATARAALEAAYFADRNRYLKGEMQVWAGDANWEGPILQYPNTFVRITQEDLDAKIKMLTAAVTVPGLTEHLKHWCTTLARFRSVCIFEEGGLAEAYSNYQTKII